MRSLAFGWPGMPDYAARSIRALIDQNRSVVQVVATPPRVPINGMERSLGQPVHWIQGANTQVAWSSFGINVPDVFFSGGYVTPAFNTLGDLVRRAGGRVVLMSDTNWRSGLRHRIVGPIRHRLLLRSRFDGIFVPGVSGERVARAWGYDRSRIATKLYGADSTIFRGGPPLTERSKTFLFVGQFIDRKNVLGLAQAFLRFADVRPDWTLTLCGSGPLVDKIPQHSRIAVRGFIQPPKLAEVLRDVRCLILPSLEEHWGLVVHEAALTGCALGLSRAVGAADDLACPANAVLFPPGDTDAMTRALLAIADWTDERLRVAEQTSRYLAQSFGVGAFADSVESLVDRLRLPS